MTNNGNMITERETTLLLDFKTRLDGLRLDGIDSTEMTADYTYDYSDTRRIKYVGNVASGKQTNIHYIDKYCEVRNGKLVKYVYAGSNRIARFDDYPQ